MKNLLYKIGTGIGLALSSAPALAETHEEHVTAYGHLQMWIFLAFVVLIFVAVYFFKSKKSGPE